MTSVELVQYVKDKADIVAVIGHYLKLTKKGADYVAICPFHDDTKPSLSISPTKRYLNALFVVLEEIALHLFKNMNM